MEEKKLSFFFFLSQIFFKNSLFPGSPIPPPSSKTCFPQGQGEFSNIYTPNLRRGRVTRINENSVDLYLLDSGQTVEAAKGSLYHLPDLARQQPPLAYPCKLR